MCDCSNGNLLCALKIRMKSEKDWNLAIYTGYQASVDDGLEEALKVDEKYQEVCMKAHRKIMRIDKIQLDRKQWNIVDDALCVSNEMCSEYGRVSYYQGFKDAVNYLSAVCSCI